MTDMQRVRTALYTASISELPGAGSSDHRVAAPGAGSRASTVRVDVFGATSWSADFAAPDPGMRTLSGLCRTPGETGLCVIGRGSAFVGDVLRPAEFGHVPGIGPIMQQMASPDGGVQLFASPWEVAVIGLGGHLWSTGRLSDRGLRIRSVTATEARIVIGEHDDESALVIDLTRRGHRADA